MTMPITKTEDQEKLDLIKNRILTHLTCYGGLSENSPETCELLEQIVDLIDGEDDG